MRKKRNIMDLVGAWSAMPELDAIFKDILECRHRYKARIKRL